MNDAVRKEEVHGPSIPSSIGLVVGEKMAPVEVSEEGLRHGQQASIVGLADLYIAEEVAGKTRSQRFYDYLTGTDSASFSKLLDGPTAEDKENGRFVIPIWNEKVGTFEDKSVAPFVHFEVTERGADVKTATVRLSEMRAAFDGYLHGFDWGRALESGKGWHAIVSGCREVNKAYRLAKQVKAREDYKQEMFLKATAGLLKTDEQGKVIPPTPEEIASAAQVAADNIAAEDAETEAEKWQKSVVRTVRALFKNKSRSYCDAVATLIDDILSGAKSLEMDDDKLYPEVPEVL